jgi:hypothetical protein
MKQLHYAVTIQAPRQLVWDTTGIISRNMTALACNAAPLRKNSRIRMKPTLERFARWMAARRDAVAASSTSPARIARWKQAA